MRKNIKTRTCVIFVAGRDAEHKANLQSSIKLLEYEAKPVHMSNTMHMANPKHEANQKCEDTIECKANA